MAFSKSFARQVPGSSYPLWVEISLTAQEEAAVVGACREENTKLLAAALKDARQVAIPQGMNTDEIVAQLAIALFEKQASHVVFWKENKAKEKFDAL